MSIAKVYVCAGCGALNFTARGPRLGRLRFCDDSCFHLHPGVR